MRDEGLPPDWDQQIIRAYTTFGDTEFGWREHLHPRDKVGRWRDIIGRLIRQARGRTDGRRQERPGPGDADRPGTNRGIPGDAPGSRDRRPRPAPGSDRPVTPDAPVIDGRTIKLGKAGRLAPHGREEIIRSEGGSTPQVYEIDAETEAGTFRDQMLKVKATPQGAAVDVYPEEDYRGMRLFTTADGTSGFSIKPDGEFVSLWSLPGAPKKVGRHMTAAGISQGARRGDAFDTVLPWIYSKEGLRVVARTPFNDEYAPDGWDYGFFAPFNGGRPDVVFMAYDPAQVGKDYVPGEGEALGPDDYELGLEMAKEAARRQG